jgi:hypothetical protein
LWIAEDLGLKTNPALWLPAYIIGVLVFLIRKAEAAPTAAEIAGRVETWLAENFAVNVDFKIADALDTLDRFSLVRRDGDRLFVPTLEPAIAQLHQVWNNFFKRE